MLSPQSVAEIEPLLPSRKPSTPRSWKVKTINRLPNNQEEQQHQQRWRERERPRIKGQGTRAEGLDGGSRAPGPIRPSIIAPSLPFPRPPPAPRPIPSGFALATPLSPLSSSPLSCEPPTPEKPPLPSPVSSPRLPISANTPRRNAVTMLSNLFFYVFISLLLSSAAAMSAYDVLKSHGLPMGLLPKGVRDFRVDDDGRFEVRLDAACTAKFESQSEVRFNSTVAGTLSYGQIAALSGVAAQELFLWFPVRGIRVDIPSSGLIYFDVGVIYKRFSLSLFETPLDCIPVSSSSKSESGKLRYELDRGDAQRAVL